MSDDELSRWCTFPDLCQRAAGKELGRGKHIIYRKSMFTPDHEFKLIFRFANHRREDAKNVSLGLWGGSGVTLF